MALVLKQRSGKSGAVAALVDFGVGMIGGVAVNDLIEYANIPMLGDEAVNLGGQSLSWFDAIALSLGVGMVLIPILTKRGTVFIPAGAGIASSVGYRKAGLPTFQALIPAGG